jgi:myxalamid-type polyketide synthase MxaB
VQLVLSPEGSEKSSFQLVSLTNDGNWKIHARGVVRVGGENSTSCEDETVLSAARKRCQEQVDVTAYYHRLHDAGLEYGPCFQGISKLWQGDGEALGLVQLPDTLAEDLGSFRLHPVMLDACFQLSMAALPDAFMETEFNDAVYLPVGLKRLRVHKTFSKLVWAHVSLQPKNSGTKESFEADIRMFDEAEQLAAELTGLYLKRVSRDALKRVMQSDGNEWLYELTWEPEELETEISNGSSKQKAGRWIIFADHSGVGKSLRRRLEAQGERCELVVARTANSIAADGCQQISPTHPDDFHHLLQETGEELGPLRGVVYMWGMNAEPGAETEQSQHCGGLLHLVQALAAGNRGELPNLWIATRGVQPVGADPELLSVASAPLWGLGGTIASEHPELNCVRVDMDPWPETDDSETLFKEIWLGSRENQVAWRKNQRFVVSMQRYRMAEDASEAHLELPSDGPFHLDLTSRGLLENLAFRAATRRQPGRGEVEIRVRATGLNFKDILKALGQYQGPDKLLGDECAGTIAAVGEGVEGLQIGDEVVALAPGSFSSHVCVASDLVVPKPDNLSFAEAATLPVVFLTAYYTLYRLAKISAGKRVLVHAAAGGVGLAAVQLAQRVGAEVFATAGSPRKRAFLRTLGIRHVMDSRILDFADEVMRLTDGHGVDIVLNALAGEFIPKSLSVLAPKGCFLEIGRTEIWDPSDVAEFKSDINYFTIFLVDTVKENPALIQELMRKLMADIQAGDITPIPHRILPIQEAGPAFRFMAQAKHIGKIVLSQEDEMVHRSPGTVHSDATYLITGGLGGLGLKVAEGLVARGARNIVLVGRQGANETARGHIQKMEETGARVVVSQADVSQPEQISAVLADISETMPPLRGIIHAAGVLDDGLLRGQSWERFDRVIAPKVSGAWNLHSLTKDNVLDFFVLFSSTAALLGAVGQGNYAGANAFLDALAHYRQAQGLPALSINWGPWAEVGMVASAHDRNQLRLKDQGMSLIPPEQGVKLLMRLLTEGPTQVAVLPINWAKFGQYHSEVAKAPFFTYLIQNDEIPTEAATEEGAFEGATAKMPKLSRRSVEAGLREQVAKVLKLPVRKVDVQQPIKDHGLDSLLALELFARIEKLYGVKLPLDILVEAPTVEQLTKRIANDEKEWSPLLAMNTGGSNLPFYCVHGAGGNILVFEELVRYLGPDQPFYGLQSQGLDGEKPISNRIEDMASLYIEEIKAVQPVGPYMLGGYCMGGTVAFEMAQQLFAQGEEVGLLALMGTYNWGSIKETSILTKRYQRIQKIDVLKRKPWLDKLASKFGRSAPKANRQSDILEAVQKANEQAAFSYIPKPYPGRIFQFLPKKGDEPINDPEMGWNRLATGGVETIMLPAGPEEMLVTPSIRLLAEKLKSYIEIVCKNSECHRN